MRSAARASSRLLVRAIRIAEPKIAIAGRTSRAAARTGPLNDDLAVAYWHRTPKAALPPIVGGSGEAAAVYSDEINYSVG